MGPFAAHDAIEISGGINSAILPIGRGALRDLHCREVKCGFRSADWPTAHRVLHQGPYQHGKAADTFHFRYTLLLRAATRYPIQCIVISKNCRSQDIPPPCAPSKSLMLQCAYSATRPVPPPDHYSYSGSCLAPCLLSFLSKMFFYIIFIRNM